MNQAKTLYDKVFEQHVVRDLGGNQYQLLIGLHLIHEATSPQAFEMLRERQLNCRYPMNNIATADHVIPTDDDSRPFMDKLGESMLSALEQNTKEFGLKFFDPAESNSGIVHILGPEQGLTQPGMTIACGDSHTSTHGAFGAVALGIGTSQVRDLIASQTLITNKLSVRRIQVDGKLPPWVSAKDVILHIIQQMGPKAGVGYVYEFAGSTIEAMDMDQRMTLCNMAVEGGARCGYVNPDQITYDYMQNTPFAPKGEAWTRALKWWKSLPSDPGCDYADVVTFKAEEIKPMTTWGINLGQSVRIGELIPHRSELDQASHVDALNFMDLQAGQDIRDLGIDVAFVGSCTNGRYSDFVQIADALQRSGRKVHAGVKAIAVPGSHAIHRQMEENGISKILQDAGFNVRLPGCSMCLAMNPDKLVGGEVCASSSNRNFKGRQGSPKGRTLIMSPLMVAAAAVAGRVSDPETEFAV